MNRFCSKGPVVEISSSRFRNVAVIEYVWYTGFPHERSDKTHFVLHQPEAAMIDVSIAAANIFEFPVHLRSLDLLRARERRCFVV
jgi:hypothetical protein